MKLSMFLGALFLGVGLVLVILTGWFGILLGVLALLVGLVLVVRGFRLRSAASA